MVRKRGKAIFILKLYAGQRSLKRLQKIEINKLIQNSLQLKQKDIKIEFHKVKTTLCIKIH